MTYRTILFETVEPHIAKITLNRPDHMNAYTNPLCDEVVDALHKYLEDDDLRCLILTGAGRGFCAGGDVSGEPRPAKSPPRTSASSRSVTAWRCASACTA